MINLPLALCMRLSVYYCVITIFCILAPFSSTLSQDLYNKENTLRFARHLLSSQQYNYAAQEFQRALFMDPGNDTLRSFLLQAYQKGERFEQGIQQIEDWYTSHNQIPRPISTQYIKLLIGGHSYDQLHLFLEENSTLPSAEKKMVHLHTALLQHHWEQAQQLYEEADTAEYPPLVAYRSLLKRVNNRPRRSPVLAVTLSAIVPGAGKIYTGRWEDGLISLIMVGVNAWQSYRGFRLKGIKNSHGWIFGSIGFAFYLGNLYGSAKSAVLFNQNVEENLVQEAERIWDQEY